MQFQPGMPFKGFNIQPEGLSRDNAPEVLARYLETREDLDSKHICFGTRTFSCRELAAEVRQGSQIGDRVVQMLLRHVERGS